MDGDLDVDGSATIADGAATDLTIGNSTGNITAAGDNIDITLTDATDNVFQILSAAPGSVTLLDIDLGDTDAIDFGDASATMALVSADWGITAVGNASNLGTIGCDGLITAEGGATVTGATLNLNASSDFATNINTGTSTGAVSIGGDSGTVAIDSSVWNVNAAGAASGLTTIGCSGLVTASAGATVSGAAINLNASSNFVTNINTGSTTAALTLGGGSGTVAIASTGLDLSTGGALSSVASVALSEGALIAQPADNYFEITENSDTLQMIFGSNVLELGSGGTSVVTIDFNDVDALEDIDTITMENDLVFHNQNDNRFEITENEESLELIFDTDKIILGSGSTGTATLDFNDVDELAGVGGITFDAAPSLINLPADGDNDDLSITLTNAHDASILIASAGTGADAISLDASAGTLKLDGDDGVDIDGGANGDIDLTSTGKSIKMTATEAVATGIELIASTGAGGITLTPGTSGITCTDANIANVGDLYVDDIVDDTSTDIMYMFKTVCKTISINDDASTDDFQFDDDAGDSAAQNVDLGEIIPGYAEVVSCQVRCFETLGAGTFQVTLGTASAGAELLAQATIDADTELDGTATGAGPKLEAANAAKHVWIQGDPSGDWTACGDGRYIVMVTYIDYGAAFAQKNPN